MVVTGGKWYGGSIKRVKGIKYVVAKRYLILGDEHIMRYADDVLKNCALDNCVINQCRPNNFN